MKHQVLIRMWNNQVINVKELKNFRYFLSLQLCNKQYELNLKHDAGLQFLCPVYQNKVEVSWLL
jgi:hypothetical protein